jgi:hypothetical protein
MTANDAFKMEMNFSEFVLKKYLKDISDEDLMTRPAKGCNHLAWQLGHLITSENSLLDMICPGAGVDLPADFVKNHAKETTASDDCALFMSKAQYLELFAQVRAATKAAVENLSAADLEKPSGMKMFPRVADVVNLIANHVMMHVGQFVVVRRLLDKPVVI